MLQWIYHEQIHYLSPSLPPAASLILGNSPFHKTPRKDMDFRIHSIFQYPWRVSFGSLWGQTEMSSWDNLPDIGEDHTRQSRTNHLDICKPLSLNNYSIYRVTKIGHSQRSTLFSLTEQSVYKEKNIVVLFWSHVCLPTFHIWIISAHFRSLCMTGNMCFSDRFFIYLCITPFISQIYFTSYLSQ